MASFGILVFSSKVDHKQTEPVSRQARQVIAKTASALLQSSRCVCKPCTGAAGMNSQAQGAAEESTPPSAFAAVATMGAGGTATKLVPQSVDFGAHQSRIGLYMYFEHRFRRSVTYH